MKKLLSLVLSFLLIASLCPALADTPPADQIATSGESYVEWYNRARATADLISYTSAGVNAGAGYVVVIATTETYETVDTIGIVYIIQRWENSQWTNYYSLGVYDYDKSILSDRRVIEVESGYYYRLCTVHRAIKDGLNDYVGANTNSIYVN